MIDEGTVELILATVSVVGFIIFFGSPTAIAIVSQVEAARYSRAEGEASDLEVLRQRAAEVTGEGAIGRYFAKAFASSSTVSFVFWVSVLFGLATLTDLVSVAFSWLNLTVQNYPLVNITLSISMGLVFVAVSAALYGIGRLTLGAQRQHQQEKDRVLADASKFKQP